MPVIRATTVTGEDGQTEIARLNIYDGGVAAEVLIPQDWRTAQELRDIATACNRVADLLLAVS